MDDAVEIIKERKKSQSMNMNKTMTNSFRGQKNEVLTIIDEMELITKLPVAEPIPDDIQDLDYVKGILKICSMNLASCLLSQDWKIRKSALLLIAKQSKYLFNDDSNELTNFELKYNKSQVKEFLKSFKNITMFIMSDNVVVLYSYLFNAIKKVYDSIKSIDKIEEINEDSSLWISELIRKLQDSRVKVRNECLSFIK